MMFIKTGKLFRQLSIWIQDKGALSLMEVDEVSLASLCVFGGYTGYRGECDFRK